MDLFDLTGRVALITGATGGIGEPTARMLAEAGAHVIIAGYEEASCETLARSLRDAGAKADALVADLADPTDLRRLIEAASALVDHIDILICNAGMEGHVGPIGEASDGIVDMTMAVNLRSTMTLTAALIPAMADRGWGSVVLVSSIAGLRGNRSIGLYGVTKAAQAQLARNLAVEWGPRGVRVNTISPGLIETPFARPILENADYLPRRLSLTPLRRVGRPREIAAAIVFLASDAAGFITGHNLVADGGTTISDGS